ncbi:MAG: sigma-70 family RNA polymerase sigma factor [Chloroflexi bacterium]|nr:sigma-70 family RNA polymerase sigma factor [Chloroflexota bacterium]
MTERTNQEWLDELQDSEQGNALDELRALLMRGLRYALSSRSNVTEADLEDFSQDALLKILAGLDAFRGESRFTTWAHKIAVNTAFSELRRRRWRDVSLQDLITQHEDEGDFTPVVLTDLAPTPEQRMTQQMMLEMVQRIIMEELTDRQRTAMMAVMMGGMPLEEVARRMDSNRNALYKLLHDARRRLKKRVMALGMTPQDVLAVFD